MMILSVQETHWTPLSCQGHWRVVIGQFWNSELHWKIWTLVNFLLLTPLYQLLKQASPDWKSCFVQFCNRLSHILCICGPRWWLSWIERSPRTRKVGCSDPSRDRPLVKLGSDSSIAKSSATGVSVTCPRRWPLKTDASCHRRCGKLKNLTAQWIMSAEYRSNVICSPSTVMVTSPNEFNILEWDNTQNEQTYLWRIQEFQNSNGIDCSGSGDNSNTPSHIP